MYRMGHTAFKCMKGEGGGMHVGMAHHNIGEFSVKFLIIDISNSEILKTYQYIFFNCMNTFKIKHSL